MKRMKTKKNIAKNEIHEENPPQSNLEDFASEIDRKIEKNLHRKTQILRKHPKSAKLI